MADNNVSIFELAFFSMFVLMFVLIVLACAVFAITEVCNSYNNVHLTEQQKEQRLSDKIVQESDKIVQEEKSYPVQYLRGGNASFNMSVLYNGTVYTHFDKSYITIQQMYHYIIIVGKVPVTETGYRTVTTCTYYTMKDASGNSTAYRVEDDNSTRFVEEFDPTTYNGGTIYYSSGEESPQWMDI